MDKHEAQPARIVTALVDAGLVAAGAREQANRVVAGCLTAPEGRSRPLGGKVAEIAGYVGGVFVAGAAVLLFTSYWDKISPADRTGSLFGIAVLLTITAAAMVGTGGGLGGLRSTGQQVRRRLVSALGVGVAVTTGLAVGVAVDQAHTYDSVPWLAGAGVALLVAVTGYLLASSAAGQLAVAVGLVTTLGAGLDVAGHFGAVSMGGPVLGLGIGWLLLAERRVWREPVAARVIGCLLAVAGAQTVLTSDIEWLGYVLTGLVGLAAFAAYVARPHWTYLATGVVALTLAVPEALSDLAHGSLGAAGGLLFAGLTLLAASTVGLRLRKEARNTVGA